jgi:hypothetical protein
MHAVRSRRENEGGQGEREGDSMNHEQATEDEFGAWAATVGPEANGPFEVERWVQVQTYRGTTSEGGEYEYDAYYIEEKDDAAHVRGFYASSDGGGYFAIEYASGRYRDVYTEEDCGPTVRGALPHVVGDGWGEMVSGRRLGSKPAAAPVATEDEEDDGIPF